MGKTEHRKRAARRARMAWHARAFPLHNQHPTDDPCHATPRRSPAPAHLSPIAVGCSRIPQPCITFPARRKGLFCETYERGFARVWVKLIKASAPW